MSVFWKIEVFIGCNVLPVCIRFPAASWIPFTQSTCHVHCHHLQQLEFTCYVLHVIQGVNTLPIVRGEESGEKRRGEREGGWERVEDVEISV